MVKACSNSMVECCWLQQICEEITPCCHGILDYETSMKLYFTCPVKNELFDSQHYSLVDGYSVVEGDERKLTGMVQLEEPCPCCGQMHLFNVDEVMCSYGRKE